MSALFSIIMPVYNVGPYLKECLESVLRQSFGDWEVICVDDGSTDGGGAYLDYYAAHDCRIKVFHQDNQGVSAARNLAIDKAEGSWLCFLDGDDVVASDWLSNYYYNIQKFHPDYIHIEHTDWCGDEFSLSLRNHEASSILICEPYPIAKWLWANIPTRGFVSDYAVKRAVVSDARFPIGVRYGEDSIFAISWLLRVSRCVISEYGGYYYRTRVGSAVKQKFEPYERCLFVDALFQSLGAIHKSTREKDINMAVECGVQNISIAVFFSWLSRQALLFDKTSKGKLLSLARIIECKNVKSRWRALFCLFKWTGWLFPLWSLHYLAVALASFRPHNRMIAL